MRKVLVLITADHALRQSALAEAIAIWRAEPVQLHLLNVQAPVSRHVSDFFEEGELLAIHRAAGLEELAPAKEALEALGIPCTAHLRVGRSAETIVEVAHEQGCDRIVMGRSAQAGFRERLFGTLAEQVRHLLGVAGNCRVIGS